MSWVGLLPFAAIAVLWLLLPGYVVSRCAGLRRVDALGAAAPVSVLVVSSSAILGDKFGLGWGLLPVLGGTAVLAAMFLAVHGSHGLLRRWQARRVETDDSAHDESADTGPAGEHSAREHQTGVARRSGLAGLLTGALRGHHLSSHRLLWPLTFLGAAALTAINLGILIGGPQNFSQTFDNVFHLNAVRWILDHLNGSSLTVTMISGNEAPSFYPMAWHDTVSLVLLTLHSSQVEVGVNATIIAVGAVVWVLGCLSLANAALRCSPLGVIAAGFLCAAFPSFPFDPVAFGVLYPNFLGIALLPGTLAIAIRTLGLGAGRIPAGRGVAVCVLCIGGVSLAHPNSFLSFCLVILPALLIWALRQAQRGWRRQAKVTAWSVWLPPLLFIAATVLVVKIWPLLQPAGQRDIWEPVESTAQAIGEALFAAPLGATAAWVIGLAAMVGAIRIIMTRRHLWMLASHLVVVFFWVVVSSWKLSPDRTNLVGGFYSDPHRIAATLPVTTFPLAVLGTSWAGAVLTRRVTMAWAARGRRRTVWVILVLIAVEIVALLQFTQRGGAVRHAVGQGRVTYQATSDAILVDSYELSLLRELPDLVPAGSVVATTPYNGASMAYGLENVATTTTHIAYVRTPDLTEINDHLDEAASRPEVCAALDRENVDYALDFGPRSVSRSSEAISYPGFNALSRSPGFELVAKKGHAALYRITACG